MEVRKTGPEQLRVPLPLSTSFVCKCRAIQALGRRVGSSVYGTWPGTDGAAHAGPTCAERRAAAAPLPRMLGQRERLEKIEALADEVLRTEDSDSQMQRGTTRYRRCILV